MNIELQKYYENRFDMFASQGWKDLLEDIDNRIKAIDNVASVKDIEELRHIQGELSALNWLKSLPQLSDDVYKQLMENSDATL